MGDVMTKRRRRRGFESLAEYFGTGEPPVSRAELADRINVTRAYVDQIVRGERSPRLAHAIAISEVTGVAVEALCRDEDRIDLAG